MTSKSALMLIIIIITSCTALIGPIINAFAQQPAAQLDQNSPQDLRRDIEKIQTNIDSNRQAQDSIKNYLEILAAFVGGITILGLLVQLIMFVIDSGIRRRADKEAERQSKKDQELNERLLQVLDVSRKVANDAQERLRFIENSGMKRSGETLRLINNLLALTERAAAKAAAPV